MIIININNHELDLINRALLVNANRYTLSYKHCTTYDDKVWYYLQDIVSLHSNIKSRIDRDRLLTLSSRELKIVIRSLQLLSSYNVNHYIPNRDVIAFLNNLYSYDKNQ